MAEADWMMIKPAIANTTAWTYNITNNNETIPTSG